MKKRRAALVFFLSAIAIGVGVRPSWAQLSLGQYQEEAPIGTWNTFPYLSAAALGRGQTAFTLARDASAGPVNPALLSFLPTFTIAAGGYYRIEAFNKYGPVNTGVLESGENIDLSIYGLDFGGVSLRLGGWALSVNVSAPEIYSRPTAGYQAKSSQGILLEQDTFTQSGILRDFNFALARKIGSRLSLGLGLDIIRGKLDRQWLEQWAGDGGMYQILDHKIRNFEGTAVNAGIVYDIPETLRLSVVVRAPFVKKSDSHSDLRYDSADGVAEISIPDSATDEFREPLVAGMGASWTVFAPFTIAADVSYYAWSKYRATFFGDPDPRDFKDIVKVSAGAEYKAEFSMFGGPAWIPVRVGVVYDPQPMTSPKSAYLDLTLGTGLELKFFHLDLGVMIGRESGSGADLTVKRFALSMGFVL
jgi:long-subunit fatty acid transport protein